MDDSTVTCASHQVIYAITHCDWPNTKTNGLAVVYADVTVVLGYENLLEPEPDHMHLLAPCCYRLRYRRVLYRTPQLLQITNNAVNSGKVVSFDYSERVLVLL